MGTTHRTSIWHLLWQMIRYAQPLYWTDTVLWLLIAGLPALPGLVIREFFNNLTSQSTVAWSSWGWISLFLAMGVARIGAIITGRITKTQHRFTISALLRRNLLAKLFERPGAEPLTVHRHQNCALSPGEVISFFREDVAQIEDNVVGTNEVLGEALFAIGSLLLLLSVNARITLFVFLPLAVIAILIHRTTDRIKRYRRASRQATQQLTGMMGEMFAAVQAIQVAGTESTVLAQFRHLCDRRRQTVIQDQLLTALLESSLENLVSLGTGAILLLAAQAMQSQVGKLTVGDFALFVYYLSSITYFLGFLGGFLALSKQSEVSFERMEGLLGCESAAIVAHHPLYLPPIVGQKPRLPTIQPSPRPESLQELVALNLTYHYPGSELTSQCCDRGITNVSLRLQRGSLTVITGPIGAGKTTLLQVLIGLLPLQAGEIYWNGQPVENPARFFVPPRSAYTPQVPQLFSHTLRENILLGLETCDEDLQRAIALACFEQDLAAMPDGLDTLIGSKGMRLSGGQLQRVAAARMFIHQPELLLFDDLSSALDLNTEQTLWSRLFSLNSSLTPWTPTCLVVSHRPAVLERADRIILLNHGSVELEGTLKDLPPNYRG